MSNSSNSTLLKKINQSIGAKFLIPIYFQQLLKLANFSDFAAKHALSKILALENPLDLQSIYFQEELLTNFVDNSLPIEDQPILLQQFHQKAQNLLRTFLFLNSTQKAELLPSIPNLSLAKTKQLIAILRQGHHKQNDYLLKFAEKDPREAIKFRLLAKS